VLYLCVCMCCCIAGICVIFVSVCVVVVWPTFFCCFKLCSGPSMCFGDCVCCICVYVCVVALLLEYVWYLCLCAIVRWAMKECIFEVEKWHSCIIIFCYYLLFGGHCFCCLCGGAWMCFGDCMCHICVCTCCCIAGMRAIIVSVCVVVQCCVFRFMSFVDHNIIFIYNGCVAIVIFAYDIVYWGNICSWNMCEWCVFVLCTYLTCTCGDKHILCISCVCVCVCVCVCACVSAYQNWQLSEPDLQQKLALFKLLYFILS